MIEITFVLIYTPTGIAILLLTVLLRWYSHELAETCIRSVAAVCKFGLTDGEKRVYDDLVRDFEIGRLDDECDLARDKTWRMQRAALRSIYRSLDTLLHVYEIRQYCSVLAGDAAELNSAEAARPVQFAERIECRLKELIVYAAIASIVLGLFAMVAAPYLATIALINLGVIPLAGGEAVRKIFVGTMISIPFATAIGLSYIVIISGGSDDS